MSSWFSDFEIKDKHIYLKSTGAHVPFDFNVIKEVFTWLPFYMYEKLRNLHHIFARKNRLKIAYYPVIAKPWYFIPVLSKRANIQTVSDLSKADAVFYFEDKTISDPQQVPSEVTGIPLNFKCHDITKTKVGEVFEEVFGYALTVDPYTYAGPIAVKSEINGAHDGYAAMAPLPKEQKLSSDMVVQRLVDNTVEVPEHDEPLARDLRCAITGGEIGLVFVKLRPLATRFANRNHSVTCAAPDTYFSPAEQALLLKFAAAMGLDWGGMDVLRHKDDDRLYVVDVNKTDVGPSLTLSFKDKSRATAILSQRLVDLITDAQPRKK